MLSKEEMEEYCNEYYSLIYKFCMKKLSNKAGAEDATQETFEIFSRKGHMLKPEHIKPWLLTTAHHMVLKEYKRRTVAKDKQCVFDEEMVELSCKVKSFEDAMVEYYLYKYINDIYERLTDREKELFDLYSDGTLKTGQIAQIMGLEPHACSMRKKRLEEKCKDIMTEILFY